MKLFHPLHFPWCLYQGNVKLDPSEKTPSPRGENDPKTVPIPCSRSLETTTKRDTATLLVKNLLGPEGQLAFQGQETGKEDSFSVSQDVNKPQEAAPFRAAPVSLPWLKPCQRFHDKLIFLDASLLASRACLVLRPDTENAFIAFFFPLKKTARSKNPPVHSVCLLSILRVLWIFCLYGRCGSI